MSFYVWGIWIEELKLSVSVSFPDNPTTCLQSEDSSSPFENLVLAAADLSAFLLKLFSFYSSIFYAEIALRFLEFYWFWTSYSFIFFENCKLFFIYSYDAKF